MVTYNKGVQLDTFICVVERKKCDTARGINMENTTKNRILEQALIMFAEKGYKGTNLRELASALGLSKSALYKHYESKEDIWNAMLEMMEEYYTERFGSVDNLPKIPKSGEELFALTMKMIHFTMHDTKVVLTRKLLLMEQFRDDRVAKLTTKYCLTGLEQMFTMIFTQMMNDGLLKGDSPEMLALLYTASVSSLIHLFTREPDRQAEVMERCEEFVRYFVANYVRE